jgi:hypothetical protein
MDRSNSIIPPSARLAGVFWKNVMADPERRKQVGCAGTPKLTLRQGPAETLPEVLHFSANKLKLRAHASGPGAVLRYADSFDPRWRAAIDGRPAPVEDGHPFKLLRLPPGRHEVEFNFHDRTQDWTLRLAGLGAVLALATLLIRETRG